MKRRLRKTVPPEFQRPDPEDMVARLPSLLQAIDKSTNQLRLALAAAGSDVRNVDPEALAMWTYTMGHATGWIMQGGAQLQKPKARKR